MTKFLVGVALALILVLALSGSMDTDAAQLAAERTERTALIEQGRTDRTTVQEIERTERTGIEQANQTERQYISAQQLMWLATERESTLRLTVMLMAISVFVTALIIATVVALRLYFQQRQPPAHIAWIAARTGTIPEYDQERRAWLLVDASTNQAYTPYAAQRELSMHR